MLTVRWKKTDAQKRQTYREQSCIAHELLLSLLSKNQIPSEALFKNKGGRPILRNVQGDVSITHTDGLCACALWLPQIEGACRVGLDAEPLLTERSAERCKRLAKRFFGPCECAFVLSSSTPQSDFVRVFVRKEAFAKYCGNGLAKNLRGCDTMAPDFCQKRGVRFESLEAEGFWLTLCTDCDEPAFFERAEE